jgi:galactokinase
MSEDKKKWDLSVIKHIVKENKMVGAWTYILKTEKNTLERCAYITSFGMLIQRFHDKMGRNFKSTEEEYDVFFFDDIAALAGSAGVGIINNKNGDVFDIEVVFRG